MKTIKTLLLTSLAILSIGSCSKAQEDIVEQSELMEFLVEHPMTRATATEFETGDAMGVFVTQYEDNTALPLQISGNYANNICSTFDGHKWINSPSIYWADGKFDVFAYYPYAKPSSVD